MQTRRQFLGALGVGVVVLPGVLRAQAGGNSMAEPMDEAGYRPVRLPPRSSTPSMSADQRDDLEHHLHCQCGTCTLDVYTCRTTDFNCPVSPQMHRDVMALVAGGHSAQEILDAFANTYGEKVLMAPKRTGFNWAGYVTPFAALGGGLALVIGLLRRWRVERGTPAPPPPPSVEGTPEELARIEAAVRSDAG